MILKGKKILLGLTGSIAAYKSATLARLFIKEGAEVRVVMTPSAEHFISRLTLSVLTNHEVYADMFRDGQWHNHVELGLWADVMVIAPCTATTLGKLTHGIADNMLLATYLSAKCPVLIAPAMDLDMWRHPSTMSNIALLKSYNNIIIPVGHGELASGLVGEGRMAEPEVILDFVAAHLSNAQDFAGKKVIITAGPTYEHLDPVRFIGNYSSGKMGVAIADELASRGAIVKLVLGPSSVKPVQSSVEVIRVTSAQEMHDHTMHHFDETDIIILSAAVADYRPNTMAEEKIKKQGNEMTLALVKNPDIAAKCGALKKEGQITVGFALETVDAVNHAKEKIIKKNLDFIVLNSLKDKGAGFGVDTNKVSIIYPNGFMQEYDLKPKTEVAKDIAQAILRINE